MFIPGHLAVAHVVARRRGADRVARIGLVALGALLPDLVDKPLMLAGVTPYGRTVGHSLVFWSFATWLWMLWGETVMSCIGPAMSTDARAGTSERAIRNPRARHRPTWRAPKRPRSSGPCRRS